MNPRILLADDEQNIRRVLSAILRREGYEVSTVADGEEALAVLKVEEFHAVITDLKMPRLDGMALLKQVTLDYPDLPVLIITAHGTVDTAVEALKLGAFDYISKPFEQDELKTILSKAVATRNLSRQDVHLTGAERGQYEIIGRHESMCRIYDIIRKVADTPSTVLITGESGTGKELISKALHENSARAAKPFIKINCAAIPKNLVESELFGYEKGAFTGAATRKPGRFELAHHGTLFLDEIAEIPLEMQVKLLRALQEHEFERVGGIKTLQVDVRLITATNRQLTEEIEKGSFREDLFYRLNVVPIHLPPLRDRLSDIPLLVEYFLGKFNKRLKRNVKEVEQAALDRLLKYPWPGNIRELENVLERTILFIESDTITEQDLPEELFKGSIGEGLRPMAQQNGSLKEIVKENTFKLEKNLIIQALKETKGNVTQAAKRLKISRKSLQNKMKEYGLREPEGGE